MKEPLSSPPGSAPLGASIPDLPHALSVSLPTWKDNVDWAEGNARVVDVMSTGYPRFFVQRNIQKVRIARAAAFAQLRLIATTVVIKGLLGGSEEPTRYGYAFPYGACSGRMPFVHETDGTAFSAEIEPF